ncbi:hypothetical protein Agub_g10293, partial [Astrephomene gubernaculifera]
NLNGANSYSFETTNSEYSWLRDTVAVARKWHGCSCPSYFTVFISRKKIKNKIGIIFRTTLPIVIAYRFTFTKCRSCKFSKEKIPSFARRQAQRGMRSTELQHRNYAHPHHPTWIALRRGGLFALVFGISLLILNFCISPFGQTHHKNSNQEEDWLAGLPLPLHDPLLDGAARFRLLFPSASAAAPAPAARPSPRLVVLPDLHGDAAQALAALRLAGLVEVDAVGEEEEEGEGR